MALIYHYDISVLLRIIKRSDNRILYLNFNKMYDIGLYKGLYDTYRWNVFYARVGCMNPFPDKQLTLLGTVPKQVYHF